MTGWGQDGPLAPTAGHDIDYIAVSGALGACARHGERPLPPVNMIGDFGGGGAFLALGIVAAMWEAKHAPAGPGRRRGDGGRQRRAHHDDARPDGSGPLAGRGGRQLRRHRLAVLRGVRVRRRTLRRGRGDRKAVLRRAAGGARSRPRRAAGPARRGELARPEGALRRRVPHPHPRRMGGALRRHRCLRGTRAVPHRGAGAPAQRRPRDVRGARRHRATRTGPAVQPHAEHARPHPSRTRRRHPRDPHRARVRTRRRSSDSTASAPCVSSERPTR